MANKQDPEVACVCGRNPVVVKHHSRYMVSCPDTLHCALRGSWAKNEQSAIKSWNTEVMARKHGNLKSSP